MDSIWDRLAETAGEEGPILRLLARDVDLEADAMGEAEATLIHVITGEQIKAHVARGQEGAA